MNFTYQDIAGMIDHSLLHPLLSATELDEGLRLARRYEVASVCVPVYAVARAAELLRDSPVRVGAVVGFPHGHTHTEAKRYETFLACRAGAVEIDMVINLGKALAEDWKYVHEDIFAVCEEAHAHKGLVKVILETGCLPSDDLKIRLCELSVKAGADFVKTSTGFAFVKEADGSFRPRGATEADVALLRKHCPETVGVKAAGGIRDLDAVLRMRAAGASRIGATATAAILDECRRRLGEAGAASGSEAGSAGD